VIKALLRDRAPRRRHVAAPGLAPGLAAADGRWVARSRGVAQVRRQRPGDVVPEEVRRQAPQTRVRLPSKRSQLVCVLGRRTPLTPAPVARAPPPPPLPRTRASLMPSKRGSLAPLKYPALGNTTGSAVSSLQRPSSGLDYAGRGEASRAHTSLGFSDSRERGRMPPRLAYIQSATYGRQNAKHARDGTDTPEAARTPRSEASPDQSKRLPFSRACFSACV